MPILIRDGNLFESKMETLVCPVNTFGVMGAGLAKAFRERYPDVHLQYKALCLNRQLFGGNVALIPRAQGPSVLLWATKEDWRMPSRLEWVTEAFPVIRSLVARHLLNSLSIPAIGCGLGGLAWADVLPHLQTLDDLPIPIEIFNP